MKLLHRLRKEPQSPEPPAMRYLVSTAGLPNFGDEFLTRAWLDYLAQERPDDEVWLDCPQPGRAVHFFADTHPRLRVTNTLWELAHTSESHDPITDQARIDRLIRHHGSPRFDEGLVTLSRATTIHVLGGGYLNEMWADNLGVVAAVAAAHDAHGMSAYLTGSGLLPIREELASWLRDRLAAFDVVELRDEQSADAVGADVGLDDAFLALALPRPVHDHTPSPDRMVLVQGDLRAWGDNEARELIRGFARGTDHIGVVEALPPEDARYAGESGIDEEFYSFGRIWHHGIPARTGQAWLTSRFHFHLLAAAAGAAGVVVGGRAGYYDVKHGSLLALGTGWASVRPGETIDASTASVDPAFPAKAREFATRKLELAGRLYG